VAGLVKDRPAAKDLASFAKQLQQLDATPEEVGTIKLLPSDGLLWELSCTQDHQQR